jgi:hypothetical protein
MIDFLPFDIEKKTDYDKYLTTCGNRGCEYSFVNLYLWGRQKSAFLADQLVFFSQFNRKSVYLFPVGPGDKKAAIDAIIQDAAQRGIPCRLTGLLPEDTETLERLYPGKFRFHHDRDSHDYVYDINGLAELRGKKYQKKRNHLNRFRSLYPNWRVETLTPVNIEAVRQMAAEWYETRLEHDPQADFQLEQWALRRALDRYDRLGLEGMVLYDGDRVIAFSIASQLSEDTMDVHFEKAREDVDGAYTAINQAFSQYLRDKHLQIRYLDREEDMGIEGLRKAKLSYCPDHMVEKYWARRWEEADEP